MIRCLGVTSELGQVGYMKMIHKSTICNKPHTIRNILDYKNVSSQGDE